MLSPTPCKDTAEAIWLEGILLAWDQRPNKNRLLIGFTDRDVNRPCWIPAPLCRYQLYQPGRHGWGAFLIPHAIANKRQWAHEADDRPPRQQRPQRPRCFRPKPPKTTTAAVSNTVKQHDLFQ